MKISEIITDKYKLRMPPTVYYDLLADVLEAEAEQETKTGHWYDKWGKDGCSVCNEGIDDAQTLDGRPFKYCTMCGAKMVELQESESKRYMELAKSYTQGLRAGLAESEDKE